MSYYKDQAIKRAETGLPEISGFKTHPTLGHKYRTIRFNNTKQPRTIGDAYREQIQHIADTDTQERRRIARQLRSLHLPCDYVSASDRLYHTPWPRGAKIFWACYLGALALGIGAAARYLFN